MSVARILVALGVLTSVLFGIHYYLWARLVRDPGLPAQKPDLSIAPRGKAGTRERFEE